ncbi:MAG TPA: RnfABCDGE type electron transport complex subunit D [Pseudomonadales bacterium]
MTVAESTARTTPYRHAMLAVMLACLPGASAAVFFFGWGVLLHLATLPLFAVMVEAIVLSLRGKPVRAGLRDCSALVTGTLLALALPPAAPWWLGFTGAVVAIAGAKHLYGGFGRNLLNPAMAAWLVLMLAFPADMARWLLPEGTGGALPAFTDSLQLFIGIMPDDGIDAFTGATALDSFRHERGGALVAEFVAASPLMGRWAGLGWEWINTGFLLGGLYLVYRGLITWHIPASMLVALALCALLFHDGGSSASQGSPLFHLFTGATMFGAFFIATDPITAPATTRGKLLYGTLIGVVVFCFRAWSAYPDGVAFAVLAGNLAAPLLDSTAQPASRARFVPERRWLLTLATVAGAMLLPVAANLVVRMRAPDREAALLAAVMPGALHDNELATSTFIIDPAGSAFANVHLLGLDEARNGYRATLDGMPSGVVLPLVAPQGYNAAIELLVGINADGAITGVRTLHHDETRGLADALDGDSSWLRAFDNRSLANTDTVLWAVKKDGGDFDQFVGATITPRATVNAIHDALQFFELNREQLLVE